VKTLLLGMGNPILRDDAVGIRLAADIGQRLGKVSGLDVVTGCSAGGLELLSVIQGYARLIVFDSIKTRGGAPGAWYRFTAADLQETMNLTNVHDTNFATALELGRRLGLSMPTAEMSHIFAVEILDNMTFDEQMTPVLERAYPKYANAIFAEVDTLLRPRH
jgi:hydrogenase maturation protease